MVNEQQETLSRLGISFNIRNGTIVEDVRRGDGSGASRRLAKNAVDFATGPYPVAVVSDESHSVTTHVAMPCHSGGTSTTIVVKSTVPCMVKQCVEIGVEDGDLPARPLREADYRNANSK